MSIEVSVVTDETGREAVYAIRRKVFVEEQGVPLSEEIDGYEDRAIHFLAHSCGRSAGTLRLRWLSGGMGKVERVAVLREFRGARVGVALMEAAELHARTRGATALQLHAQTDALPFYEKLGYRAKGETFQDAGIEHITMDKKITPAGE